MWEEEHNFSILWEYLTIFPHFSTTKSCQNKNLLHLRVSSFLGQMTQIAENVVVSTQLLIQIRLRGFEFKMLGVNV